LIVKIFVALACLATISLSQTPPKGKAFDHIFIVWLEEYDPTAVFSQVFNLYTSSGVLLSNYHGVTEGTQANHIASIGGDYFGLPPEVTFDNSNPNLDIYNIPANYTTIVDLLEAKGLTWRAYEEDLPSPCYTASYSNNYYRRYDPFVTFASITNNATRCANIVPATQLSTDISQGNFPNYIYYTPNYLNNGDGSNFTYAAAWVNKFIPPLLTNPTFMNNTLIVLLFDDNDSGDTPDNEFHAILFGDAIPAALHNTTDNQFYTHYSLLSTVEDNWGLGNLGRNDANPELSNVFNFASKAEGVMDISVPNPPNLTNTEAGFLNTPNSASANIGSKVVGGLLAGITALIVLLL